jgi:hypothetical protein
MTKVLGSRLASQFIHFLRLSHHSTIMKLQPVSMDYVKSTTIVWSLLHYGFLLQDLTRISHIDLINGFLFLAEHHSMVVSITAFISDVIGSNLHPDRFSWFFSVPQDP